MDFVAHKINRSRWGVESFMEERDVTADAVTNCLKTSSNVMSWWMCEDGRKNVEEVALAMGTMFKSLEKAHFVAVSVAELESVGLILEHVPSPTPVKGLEDIHINLVDLTAKKLTTLAEIIARRVRVEDGCHDFSMDQMQSLVLRAVRNRRVAKEHLKPAVRERIESLL